MEINFSLRVGVWLGLRGMRSKMKNIARLGILLAFVLVVQVVVAEDGISEASFCCERTNDGAWCVNADEDECRDSYSVAPTSCETTSYCRLGTCYDSDEGICMENTPQRVCDANGGTWDEKEVGQVPQCQLGCCIIADQAAFVSLVRCKKLSGLFGVENNYRTDITNEISCIATAQSQDVGACVYERDFERICDFTTRGECVGDGGKVFYKDFLCSAEELNTVCAKQVSTTCYRGDVYWVDSCGNRENVYSKDEDKSWNSGIVLGAGEVCGPSDGEDKDCGNCDYMLGTRCSEDDSFLGGEAYCKKTVCRDSNGDTRINGESWCVTDSITGEGADMVGSRYFREVCVDGEVMVEPCADFRNEVCIENSVDTVSGDFSTAACKINRWQDCILQEEEEDCLKDSRDCIWIEDIAEGTVFGVELWGLEGEEKNIEETSTNSKDGYCVADVPPGLEFWEEGNAQQICGAASSRCVVTYELGLIGKYGEWKSEAEIQGDEELDMFGLKKKVIEGSPECLDDDWALKANRICVGMGDCGGYVNYNRIYTDDGYKWTESVWKGAESIWDEVKKLWVGDTEEWVTVEKEFSDNDKIKIKGGFSGMVVK